MGILGVGTDTIEIARIADVLARRPRFAERCFTSAERDYCASRPTPAQHFAVRFAAKEAVGKALGVGITRWHDVEIHRSGGRPSIILSGKVAEQAERLGVYTVFISMSHSRTDAVAVAVADGAGSMSLLAG